jgi:hypothetical protein
VFVSGAFVTDEAAGWIDGTIFVIDRLHILGEFSSFYQLALKLKIFFTISFTEVDEDRSAVDGAAVTGEILIVIVAITTSKCRMKRLPCMQDRRAATTIRIPSSRHPTGMHFPNISMTLSWRCGRFGWRHLSEHSRREKK